MRNIRYKPKSVICRDNAELYYNGEYIVHSLPADVDFRINSFIGLWRITLTIGQSYE